MKKFWKERLKFFFDFDEFHFVFDNILQIMYMMIAGTTGSILTVFLLKPELKPDSVLQNVTDVFLSAAFETFVFLAFIMIAIVLFFRLVFLGIGKLIETWINKKQVKEDASV